MPRIIRSTGVNIQNARPVVVSARAARQPDDNSEQLRAASAREQRETEKIQVSAELIVEEILSRARSDADNMLVDARAETIKILQEAVQEGREQGMRQALIEMHELKASAEAELARAVDALQSERQQLIRSVEQDVLELVCDIADKVLEVEMNRSDEWVAAVVRAAMQQMEGDEAVVLKVSAEARKRVDDAVERALAAGGNHRRKLTVLTDPAMKAGGSIIETAKGAINNGAEDKLDRLKTVLRENS